MDFFRCTRKAQRELADTDMNIIPPEGVTVVIENDTVTVTNQTVDIETAEDDSGDGDSGDGDSGDGDSGEEDSPEEGE